jgi:hypothetical protein
MTPELFVASLSAGLQAIQTWIAVRDRKVAEESYKSTVNSLITGRDTTEEAKALESCVPPNILNVMMRRADICFTRFQEVINPGTNFLPAEVDEATQALKACVCRELKRIIVINGSIPSQKLQILWQRYECKD